MLKKMLVLLGLRAAPTPIKSYIALSSLIGGVPAALLIAWKYRGKIAPMLHRASPQSAPAAAT